ncbi:MAG: galactokinase [Pseudomonadota bacterium]
MSHPTPQAVAQACFSETFGTNSALTVTAPGRVNLIGEHTDYNDGFVLPAALQFYTAIAAAPRADRVLDVVAADWGNARVQIDLDAPLEHTETAPWSNYVRGVVQALFARGYQLAGAQLAISGDVPQGAGLSSSAALEVALAQALTRIAGEAIDGVTAAKVGQSAENDFFGCQCGIMDQLISAIGARGHALLIDCRSLEAQPIALPPGFKLLVIHSNVQRALAVDGEYDVRRAQCEQAAAHFGVSALRDLTETQLTAERAGLDPVVLRRARHVVTENARTLAFASALREGDLSSLAPLMAASHASMRDDFEMSVPPVDALVEIVTNVLGTDGGARMTGGGFGGCVVALLPPERLQEVRDAVAREYPARTGLTATIYECETRDGAFAEASAS